VDAETVVGQTNMGITFCHVTIFLLREILVKSKYRFAFR